MYIEECTRHLLLMYIQQKVSIEMNNHLEHIISLKNDSIEYSLNTFDFCEIYTCTKFRFFPKNTINIIMIIISDYGIYKMFKCLI